MPYLSRVDQARRICVTALRPVPFGTTRKFCEGLLRPLYPWGERRRYPYKAWRTAVRQVLAERAKWERWDPPKEQWRDTPMFAEQPC